jgi:hypothetical protein
MGHVTVVPTDGDAGDGADREDLLATARGLTDSLTFE